MGGTITSKLREPGASYREISPSPSPCKGMSANLLTDDIIWPSITSALLVACVVALA